MEQMEQSVKTILVVDDDNSLAAMLKKVFEMNGWRCETADCGKSALGRLAINQYELMLTDIVMPGMDGFELVEKAKQIHPDMMVIMMTGFSEFDSYDKAIASGAADFVKKPFQLKELLVRIDRIERDMRLIEEARQREQAMQAISREMIAGIQEETRARLEAAEEKLRGVKGAGGG
ncbi:MAG: response regulator [Nitrospirae bacterium]|nr:response regulator [Nitrospirota bacterium]